MFRVLGEINGTASLVNLENANTYELKGLVHADGTVIGAGKQQITILIVLNLVDGTRVTC